MNLIVNEWVLEYCLPHTPALDRKRLVSFLEKFQYENSKIVIGRETPFTQKFYRYMKQYGYDPLFKKKFVILNNIFFHDSLKTILVEKDEIRVLPNEDKVGVNSDDLYLLELAITVPDASIVSTDTKLIQTVTEKGIIKIIHLMEYLESEL